MSMDNNPIVNTIKNIQDDELCFYDGYKEMKRHLESERDQLLLDVDRWVYEYGKLAAEVAGLRSALERIAAGDACPDYVAKTALAITQVYVVEDGDEPATD